MQSPHPKNKTENDSRLLKNNEGNRNAEWNFCRGKEADIGLFLQVTRIRSEKIFEANQLTIALNWMITSNEPNETQKYTKWIEIHQSQAMTF